MFTPGFASQHSGVQQASVCLQASALTSRSLLYLRSRFLLALELCVSQMRLPVYEKQSCESFRTARFIFPS